MRIIVIGMDNTGKTTLCEKLHNHYGYPIIKSPGPDCTKEEMVTIMEHNLSYDNVILERFALFEEMVYGKLLRGKSKFNFKDYIFKKLKELNLLIIYCRPSNKTIFNFGSREQMGGVIDKSQELLKQWDKIYRKIKRSGLNIIKWNYEKDSIIKF